MTLLPTLPDIEAIAGDYLRAHANIQALGANVAGRMPADPSEPWVLVTMLDATAKHSTPEHFIQWYVDFDCYASSVAAQQDRQQAEAVQLGLATRAVLKALEGKTVEGVVFSCVEFTIHSRIPDTSFSPARERIKLNAQLYGHTA